MARKAVQGYPEKSYYDNTRYLGIVATTDPLNEGLFKHMVNFDVSDTGQSVTPREGFLTTTLKGQNIISLSNNTIRLVNISYLISQKIKHTLLIFQVITLIKTITYLLSQKLLVMTGMIYLYF
jgi:hypothetical protein